ncbi:general substrate transporter [Hortaea werneckii]|nr:general substrate transporter [Hortaea werneckii]KAI7058526.1 general substrate transporter [Hortaea werneckii]KAI7211073.1 general substrate transporter [Hortaea werneckii]KAI7292446.1 general substrate transporter [Hortaea werneckii]KAI7377052.1 general substrate transporter [Hortaea werneckii]
MRRVTHRLEDQSLADVALEPLHDPAMNRSKKLEVTHTEKVPTCEASKASFGPPPQESLTEILRRRPIKLWGRGSLHLYAICLLVYLCSTMNGYDGSLMGSINAVPSYTAYYGLPPEGNSSTGIVFAIYQFGQMAGALFSWVMDWRGRRWPIFIGCTGVCVGAVVTAVAPTIPALIGGRFLLSFFSTFALVAAPTYLIEISPPQYRGTLAGLYNTLYYLGSILATSVVYGAERRWNDATNIMSWRLSLWLQMACPGIVAVFIWLCPESPRYLVAKGHSSEARNILANLHANGDATHPLIDLEMREMHRALEEEAMSWRTYLNVRDLFKSRSRRYRMMLNMTFAWFGQFSGNNVVSYYLPRLVSFVGVHDPSTQLLLNIIYAITGWIPAVVGARLSDIIGRRKLLLGVTIGMSSCLAIAAGTAAHFVGSGSKPASVASITFIYLFGSIFALAFTSMQPIYPGEVLSNDMRAKGMGVFQLTSGCAGFVNTFAAPVALNNIGYWFYVFFVFWDLFEFVFIYFYYVETSKRTLEELDAIFEAHNPRKASTCRPSVQSAGNSQSNTTTEQDGLYTTDHLQALDEPPHHNEDPENEEPCSPGVQVISDDVNGLAFTETQHSSYVGICSNSAAFKVMWKIAPALKTSMAQRYSEKSKPPHRPQKDPSPHSHQQVPTATDARYIPPPGIAQHLLNSYFYHVHPLMPMVDEASFWRTWLYSDRSDSPWLALLNVVFALGSLASGTAADEGHRVYYLRARSHLCLESFGSNNILLVQALGLLSGYYLHWLNRPNEASGLMGATLRMATSLGLHREFGESQSRPGEESASRSDVEAGAETRRRTWWSLFVLDTWANMTTGRPPLGRYGPGITARDPRLSEQKENESYWKLLPLKHNIAFCKLATEVQDHLAEHAMPTFERIVQFDAELTKWHNDLPSSLRLETPSSPPNSFSPSDNTSPLSTSDNAASNSMYRIPSYIETPRAIMHWRCHNLRLLMYRPFLLAATLRRATNTTTRTQEGIAVSRCRATAAQAIHDIDVLCGHQLVPGWAGVWLMFQAAITPLLSLFAYSSAFQTPGARDEGVMHQQATNADDGNVDAREWYCQLQTAIAYFDRMRPWSVVAERSRDVLTQLCEVCTNGSADQNLPGSHPIQSSRVQQSGLSDADTHSARNNRAGPSAGGAPFIQDDDTNLANTISNQNFTEPDIPMETLWDHLLWDMAPFDPNTNHGSFPVDDLLGFEGELFSRQNDGFG